MQNSFKKLTSHNRSLIISTIVFFIFVFTTYSVWASNIVKNGSFATDLNYWSLSGQDGYQAPQSTWQNSGYSGTIINGGNSYSASGGAVRLYSGKGSGIEKKGYLAQSFTVNQLPSQGVKLSFAWKKTWAVKKPSKQDIRVYLVVPGGTVYELWAHQNVANTSDNSWYKVEELDITNRITTTGTYEIRLHTWLKTGSDSSAEADAWYDEIYINLPGDSSTGIATPQGLNVENEGSGGALNLSWQVNSEDDLAGYNLYRSNDDISFSKINSTIITGTVYFDTGLTEGQTYYYKITAENTSGVESEPSSSVSGIPMDTVPQTPTGLQVVNVGNGNELNLFWDSNFESDLFGYNIYRSKDGVNFLKLNQEVLKETGYSDLDLDEKTTYFYKVSALDAKGQESALSPAVSGTPQLIKEGPGILKNPSIVQDLSGWFFSENISPIKGSTMTIPQPSYLFDSGGYSGTLLNGSTNYDARGGTIKLEVKGTNKVGRGHAFQRILFKPSGNAYLSFAWKKNYSGTAPFEQTARVVLIKPNSEIVTIWVDTNIRNNSWQKVENMDLTSHFTVHGSYQLEFWGHLRNSNDSAAENRIYFDELILSVTKAPTIPKGLSALPVYAGGGVELKWTANQETNISGYEIWRSPNGVDFSLIKTVTGNEYTDIGLTNGKVYYYKIIAIDTGGRKSPFTRPLKVYPRAADLFANAHTGYLTNTNACQLCHISHKAEAPMLLNRSTETAVCLTCHDGIGSIFNLADDYSKNKISYHPVADTELAPTGNIYCSSCHDPHDSTGKRTSPIVANGSIQGSIGVEVNYSNNPFAQPATTLKHSINKEYEQCLRCHSSHNAGSEKSTKVSMGKEFNPYNLSYHGSLGDSKASGFGTYLEGWQPNMAIFCSDCHGSSDDETAGPHSSGYSNILKLPYNPNPASPNLTLCWSCHNATNYGNGGGSDKGTFFVFRGSDPSKGYATFEKNLHNSPGGHKNLGCSACHSAIPHGINRRALLVTTADPKPYSQYAQNTSIIYPNDGNWQYNSCATTPGCHK